MVIYVYKKDVQFHEELEESGLPRYVDLNFKGNDNLKFKITRATQKSVKKRKKLIQNWFNYETRKVFH